jgi:ACT domain-containing protein
MTLSDFEIGKIAEIVAGKSGAKLDAKALRLVIDRVVDALKAEQGNPEVEGATCEVGKPVSSQSGVDVARETMLSKPPATSAENEPGEGGPQLAVGSSLQPPDEAMITARGSLYEQIEKTDKTRVIIAAFGKDRPGVGAALTGVLAEHNCSIEDISQTLLQDFFSMIMIVNIEGSTVDFATLVEALKATETQLGMKVYVMHEDTFRYMHRI